MATGALNNNAMYAYNYLQKKYNYTPVQAAGIVGNLMQESSMNTGARNKGDGSGGDDSIGLGQWNGDRSKALYNFAATNRADPGNIDTQLDFIHHELNGTESGAGNRLANATDVNSATAAMIGYERPQGYSVKNPQNGNGWGNRLGWAQKLVGVDPSSAVQATSGALPQAYVDPQITTAANASSQPVIAPQGAQVANPNAGKPYEDGAISWFANKLGIGTPTAQPATVAANADGQATEPSRGLAEKLGLGKMPSSIMGVNTNKAAKAMGAFTAMQDQQQAAVNQQLQQVAAQGQARAANDKPIEIQTQATPTFQSSGGGMADLSPDQLKKLQMLLAMQKAGGLGGFGGVS